MTVREQFEIAHYFRHWSSSAPSMMIDAGVAALEAGQGADETACLAGALSTDSHALSDQFYLAARELGFDLPETEAFRIRIAERLERHGPYASGRDSLNRFIDNLWLCRRFLRSRAAQMGSSVLDAYLSAEMVIGQSTPREERWLRRCTRSVVRAALPDPITAVVTWLSAYATGGQSSGDDAEQSDALRALLPEDPEAFA